MSVSESKEKSMKHMLAENYVDGLYREVTSQIMAG